EHERRRQRDARAGEQAGEQDADGNAKSWANTNPVPGAHLQTSVVTGPFERLVCREENVRRHLPQAADFRRKRMSDDKPLLVFFTSERSGPARRMESLLAHLARKERTRVRVMRVEIDDQPELAQKFRVTTCRHSCSSCGSRSSTDSMGARAHRRSRR